MFTELLPVAGQCLQHQEDKIASKWFILLLGSLRNDTLTHYKAMYAKCCVILINAKVFLLRKWIQSRLLTEKDLRRSLEAVRTWVSLSTEERLGTFSPSPVLLVGEHKGESGRLVAGPEHQQVTWFVFFIPAASFPTCSSLEAAMDGTRAGSS